MITNLYVHQTSPATGRLCCVLLFSTPVEIARPTKKIFSPKMQFVHGRRREQKRIVLSAYFYLNKFISFYVCNKKKYLELNLFVILRFYVKFAN